MRQTSVIVIGGSQAGLSLSYYLSRLGISHLVLERGKPGQRWRHERWDSLSLLTPNWQNILPGYVPRPDDPHGYMTRGAFAEELARYAEKIAAPVCASVQVEKVSLEGKNPSSSRFSITTSRGSFCADAVVTATGQCALPRFPPGTSAINPTVFQIHSASYRRPSDLPAGGVLVVGASASGLQLAEEIHQSGRPVTLAVGPHTRMPRRYRGLDILAWLERAGILGDSATELDSAYLGKHRPSLQLIGTRSGRDLDLQILANQGVRLVGSVEQFSQDSASLRCDLQKNVADSERRMQRVLTQIDEHILQTASFGSVPAAHRPQPLNVAEGPAHLNFAQAGIHSVLFATGYRPELGFLPQAALTDDGEARHVQGRSPLPGLFFLGLNFQKHRNSSAIYGVGQDARVLARELQAFLREEKNHAA